MGKRTCEKCGQPLPGTRISQQEAQYAREAANAIMNGFRWDQSKEGSDYWQHIWDRLQEIAETEMC